MKEFSSEWLKYKRTFTKKLILGIPLIFVLKALLLRVLLPGTLTPWEGLLALTFNWWPVVFLPLGFGIFSWLGTRIEDQSGAYKILRTEADPQRLWMFKILTMGALSLLSHIVLGLSTFLGGMVTASGPAPVEKIALGCLLCFLSSLPLIPLCLWAAHGKGLFFVLSLSLAGFLGGVLGAQKPFWFLVPWSLATRLMAPVMGVHPNGVPLERGDPLLRPGQILPGLLAAFFFFALFTFLSAKWFRKREVRR